MASALASDKSSDDGQPALAKVDQSKLQKMLKKAQAKMEEEYGDEEDMESDSEEDLEMMELAPGEEESES